MPRLSSLAKNLKAESAFTVLALARVWKAKGKEVVELEIGDSPFPTPPHAKAAGIHAIEANETGYGPSLGLPDLRSTAASWLGAEFEITVGPENIAVASGAKPFEQYFAEALLEPGDGVLLFSPHFPTYEPNLQRRGARAVISPLLIENDLLPTAEAIQTFLRDDPQPRAVWLNSPHNPTGRVVDSKTLDDIADVVRGTDLMVFSDEPYCHMVWGGRHESLLSRPGMLDHVVAAYTFSKSYSMSGWRIGFAAAHPDIIDSFGKLINTTASCSPPFVQRAAIAALKEDTSTRDDYMNRFRVKVESLTAGLAKIDGIRVSPARGTFYVFPDVRDLCNRLGLTSAGLAHYFLEGADDHFGVACLGGEAFGNAGQGFLRFSCSEPDDKIAKAVEFLPTAISRTDRVKAFLQAYPQYVLASPY
jgi:aspartate aminotransferase